MMRVYLREFCSALLLYVAALCVSIYLLTHGHPSHPIRTVYATLPIPTLFVMCWVIIRQIRRIDEMHLRVQLEALGFAFAGTALVSFSYGFLENAGFPYLSMFCVWPVMCVFWIIGQLLTYRRFR